MRKFPSHHQFMPLMALLLIATSVMWSQSAKPASGAESKEQAAPKFEINNIDKSVDPCTDFYQYACGNWIKGNPIPGDQVRWARSFSLLQERNRYLLWQDLDAASKDPKTALQKQYGDYFAACTNTELLEKKGLEPIQPALKSIT